jgi:hypothetical protein
METNSPSLSHSLLLAPSQFTTPATYIGVLVRKIFHTGVTRSITYVAMILGNQWSSDDDVINTSLRRAGSVAQASPEDRIEMKATINWGKAGRRREVTRVGVVSLATYMILERVWNMWTALLWVRTLYT